VRWSIAALALSLALLAGCAGAPTDAATAADPAALVRERCVKCHTLDRIKNAQHDAAGWEATVARMRGRGAQVDDAEAAAVAAFLAGNGGDTL
jgi:mono/diheme cytochrome c family protein